MSIGAAIATGAIGYGIGHRASPVRTVERIVEDKAETTRTEETHASRELVANDVKEVIRWRTRVVIKPDGTRIESKSTEKGNESKASAEKQTQSAAVTERIVTQTRYVERIVDASRPRWSFGVAGGLDTGMRRAYGVDVGIRAVGPLWVTMSGSLPSRSAMLGLRLEF